MTNVGVRKYKLRSRQNKGREVHWNNILFKTIPHCLNLIIDEHS